LKKERELKGHTKYGSCLARRFSSLQNTLDCCFMFPATSGDAHLFGEIEGSWHIDISVQTPPFLKPARRQNQNSNQKKKKGSLTDKKHIDSIHLRNLLTVLDP
jgi:hypothetical protein